MDEKIEAQEDLVTSEFSQIVTGGKDFNVSFLTALGHLPYRLISSLFNLLI